MSAEPSFGLDLVFAADVERVFAALIDPAALASWAWAGLGTEPTAFADPRPGGAWWAEVTAPEADRRPPFGPRWRMGGLYTSVAAPTHLAYTLHWGAPVGYNEAERVPDEWVDLRLEREGDRTRLHYRHWGVPSAEAARGHAAGTRASLRRLAEWLDQDAPKSFSRA